MKLLSVALIVLSIILALVLTGHIKTFIDLPSLLVVILPVLASIPARHGLEGFKILINSGDEKKEVLHSMGATGIISGVLGSHIGVVIILANMSKPDSLGPALAVSLLPTFYGLFIFLLTTVISHLNLGNELWL